MQAVATKTEQTDKVDRLIESWADELEGIDLDVEAAVQRIQWVFRHIRGRMEETLAETGLNHGEWGLLGHLALGGPPHRDSPGRLASKEGLSSGAMTNRLDRLEAAGLIRRLPNPDDRRGLQVELTKKGHALWRESVDTQAAKEAALAEALSPKELEQLNRLLRKVLLRFEAR
jgi:DNA-binding MarR family transcriptional regulator